MTSDTFPDLVLLPKQLGSTCPHAVQTNQGVVKESAAFIASPKKEGVRGQLLLPKPWTPDGFQGRTSKSRVGEVVAGHDLCSAHAQFSGCLMVR